MLTGLSAYLFHMALTAERLRLEREELRREAGGVLILCCALMALARVTIMDVLCLGRVAAVLCVMVSSFGAGAAEGASSASSPGCRWISRPRNADLHDLLRLRGTDVGCS